MYNKENMDHRNLSLLILEHIESSQSLFVLKWLITCGRRDIFCKTTSGRMSSLLNLKPNKIWKQKLEFFVFKRILLFPNAIFHKKYLTFSV